MRRVVIGTAGHIDHGKTALVRALTGIDTDRLETEKRRGITIELGFTHLRFEDGTVAGLVDVPGHERFVKAMAAGAGGIDLAVLVVAADEGVMPQTREHVDILRLLGVHRGVIALTKSDLLPALGEDWLPLLEADLAEVCAGTFLENAPRVLCSARTGEGLPELVRALQQAAEAAQERPTDGPLYLPVDRTFSVRGFGTVVTGTLLSGSVGCDDVIDLIPGGPAGLRVRGVQVHGEAVERGFAGQRVAVNLAGVEPQEIERGMVVAARGELPATPMLDVELSLLESAPRPLTHRSRWLLHVGTAQVPATVALLEGEELAAGESGLAQLRLAAPLAALPGQHFILRGFAPIPGRGQTVAGGRVLAILPRKHRRQRQEVVAGLEALRGGDDASRVEHILREAGASGLDLPALSVRTALPAKALGKLLEQLGSRGVAVCYDRERKAWVSGAVLERLARKALLAVDHCHRAQPLAPGLPREELRARLGLSDSKLFTRLVALLCQGEVEANGDHLRRKGHRSGSGASEQALRSKVVQLLRTAALTPPAVAELATETGETPDRILGTLKLLASEGLVVRVSQELWFDGDAVAALRERLVDFLLANEGISTQQFKELVGATRKWVMPLGEYFDAEKVTLRVADSRRILRGGAEAWRARREAEAGAR